MCFAAEDVIRADVQQTDAGAVASVGDVLGTDGVHPITDAVFIPGTSPGFRHVGERRSVEYDVRTLHF